MLTLYGAPLSRAFRCVWMLEELGLDYELVPTGYDNGDNRQPDFLAINPNGKVPALVDGDTVLWESLAINHYLADCHGKLDGPLCPRSDEDRALAYRWSFWAMGELEGPIDTARRFEIALDEDWAAAPLGVLERALTDAPWLAGDGFGLADLNVSCMFLRPALAKAKRGPRVEAWLARCRARDGWARMAERAKQV